MLEHGIACAFFGLPENADIYQLLGVHKNDGLDSKTVKRAMRRRYAQLLTNPNPISDETQIVKKYLGVITSLLLKESPQEDSLIDTTRQQLTELDQTIIAALIAGGGWNSKTRSRLVEIAASYSLTVGGLMRILEALAESARDGKGPLTIERRSEISIDRTWTKVPPKKSSFSFAEEYISDITEKITPDFSVQNPVLTIKLAVVFGFLTLVAFVLALVVLFSDSNKVPFEEQLKLSSVPRLVEESQATKHPLFTSFPTFARTGIDTDFVSRADEVLLLREKFTDLHNQIQESNTSVLPSTWMHEWITALDTIASGWSFADAFLVNSLSEQIIRIIQTADSQRMPLPIIIQAFDIPPFQSSLPLSVSKRIWFASILSSLSCETKLRVGTRSLIKQMQLPSVNVCGIQEARREATVQISIELIARTEFDSNYLAVWEAWIHLVKGSLRRSDASYVYLESIKNFLDENIDFTRESDSRKVVGRLVSEIDWMSNTGLRDALLSFYTSMEISSDDLFLLSHLLFASNNISWFLEPYIVLQNDSQEKRNIKADALRLNWPSEIAPKTMVWNLQLPAGFSEQIVGTWNKSYFAYNSLPPESPYTLASIRNLNESAVSIWLGRPGLALEQLTPSVHLEEGVDFNTAWNSRTYPIDGEWAKTIGRRGANIEERLDALDKLASGELTNLGPEDAQALANAALLSVYSRIRTAATDRIVSQFSQSKNVAVAILNSLIESKYNEQVATLVAQLTEAILPDQTDLFWNLEARKALLQHALICGDEMLFTLDAAAAEITNSLLSEYLLLRPTALPPSHELTPLEAFAMVIDAWKLTLPDFDFSSQDFNASNEILQSYLQLQLIYFEILRLEEARWRGKQILGTLLVAHIEKESTIIQQIMLAEKSIADHWHYLFQEMKQEYLNRIDSQ